jgi:hypothetical protein
MFFYFSRKKIKILKSHLTKKFCFKIGLTYISHLKRFFFLFFFFYFYYFTHVTTVDCEGVPIHNLDNVNHNSSLRSL